MRGSVRDVSSFSNMPCGTVCVRKVFAVQICRLKPTRVLLLSCGRCQHLRFVVSTPTLHSISKQILGNSSTFDSETIATSPSAGDPIVGEVSSRHFINICKSGATLQVQRLDKLIATVAAPADGTERGGGGE